MAVVRRSWHPIAWMVAAVIVLGGVGLSRLGWPGGWIAGLEGRGRPAHHVRLAEAESAYNAGDWSRAADLSREALKATGDDPEALRVYARAQARLGRDASAWAIYDGRLGVDRMLPEDYFLVGSLLVRADELDRALAVWKKGATIAPDHPELLDGLSRLAIQLKWLDEADEAARRLARFPRWEARAWLLRGEIQGLLENPRGAIDALREGLRIDPEAKGARFSAARYHLLLARNALELGRIDDAIASLQQATAAAGPSDAPVSEIDWLLSRAYLRKGRIPDALATLHRAGSYREQNPLLPEPSPYVGSARCVPCHSKEGREHEHSRHARTFHHGAGLLELPLPNRPLPDPAAPGVTHTFERDRDRIRIETRAADRVFRAIVDYAFGVPELAVTMVGRDAEKTYRAARLSSYQTEDGLIWGRSLGDVPDTGSMEAFRGEPIGVRDGVVRCLYCHVTRARDFRDPPAETSPGPEAADKGIGCERCHGPGENHLAAIAAGFPDHAIVNSGTASASAIVEQCADCHIVGVPGEIRETPENPAFVRSPGATLTASRCYTESAGGLSCLTCHNPHRDDREPATFFESKCLGCHAPTTASQKSCRVNPSRDCLGCHMPKVPVKVLHTSMTDHYIRIHKSKNR